jgi:hypothetical protein
VLRRSVYQYTQIGDSVLWLQQRNEGDPILGEGHTQGVLASLKKALAELGLPVSHRMFRVNLVGEIADELKAITTSEGDDPPTLTGDQAERLSRAMSALHTTLIAEAMGVFAFIVTEKRVPSEVLLDDIGKLFDDGIFENLPDLAKRDMQNAGKAIAFELPTAAVFHLMRALEAVLRDLYCHFIRQNRLREPRNWKQMLDQMRKKKTNPPPGPLLDHFDHIREHFRNPTQHPDAEYDMNAAQNLLNIAVDAIDRAVVAMS